MGSVAHIAAKEKIIYKRVLSQKENQNPTFQKKCLFHAFLSFLRHNSFLSVVKNCDARNCTQKQKNLTIIAEKSSNISLTYITELLIQDLIPQKGHFQPQKVTYGRLFYNTKKQKEV